MADHRRLQSASERQFFGGSHAAKHAGQSALSRRFGGLMERIGSGRQRSEQAAPASITDAAPEDARQVQRAGAVALEGKVIGVDGPSKYTGIRPASGEPQEGFVVSAHPSQARAHEGFDAGLVVDRVEDAAPSDERADGGEQPEVLMADTTATEQSAAAGNAAGEQSQPFTQPPQGDGA